MEPRLIAGMSQCVEMEGFWPTSLGDVLTLLRAPKARGAYNGAKDDGKFLKGEEAGRQKAWDVY